MGTKKAKKPEDLVAQVKQMITKLRESGNQPDVTKLIVVHMTWDEKKHTGWVHTHGMWDIFGLPDLEIRNIHPLVLMPPAGVLVNEVAQYMVDFQGKKEVKAGQNMMIGRSHISFQEGKAFEKDEIEGHYKTPVLRIVDNPKAYVCVECEEGKEGHEHS